MTTPAPATPEGGNNISPELVKQLREKTSAGMMDCKKALVEAKGDLAAAETILRKKGAAQQGKKAGREAKEGVIGSYIHVGDKVGVLVEINCETDFVARNESFRAFVKDVTLQVAAATPLFVKRDEVPENLLAVEKDVASASVKGKPANVGREDHLRQGRQILQHRVPARADLREGQHQDDQRSARRQDRRSWAKTSSSAGSPASRSARSSSTPRWPRGS